MQVTCAMLTGSLIIRERSSEWEKVASGLKDRCQARAHQMLEANHK